MKIIVLFLLSTSFFALSFADEWPQWRGPDRNGYSKEKNLLTVWPDGGLKLLWSAEKLGDGYSSASIAGGDIYITGVIANRETISALDLKGNLKWQTTFGDKWKGSYPEARSTPTVDGQYVYAISGMGDAVCFERQTGQIKWSVQFIDKFDGEYHRWGVAESPLIVDDKFICTPGGSDASLVALDKLTGSLIWQTEDLSEENNYCSPILIRRGGKKIIATQLSDSFVGVDSENGRLLWSEEYDEYQEDPKDININSPLYHDGLIYVTSGYDNPSAMYQLADDGLSIKRMWVNDILDVHVGGVVFLNGYIYGSNWENNRNGNWVCLDANTGKVQWEHKWHTKGSIITAEDMLYCYEEKNGNLGLVKANPEKFDLISSFRVTKGKGKYWAHPAIANSRLYIRHGEVLMVYDISKK
jgi:outer membrane protein assembly factor BamB